MAAPNPGISEFEKEKIRTVIQGKFNNITGYFSFLNGAEFSGYEIHMGKTYADNRNISEIKDTNGNIKNDGLSVDNILGTYIHGIFDSSNVAKRIIDKQMQEKGIENQAEEKNINELIKPGDPIIVEVKKEAVDKKGPRLSTHITLTNRFVVFMPNSNFITVSQKIENNAERERLKEIVQKYLPEGSGAIIRTVAENKPEEELKNDISFHLLKEISFNNPTFTNIHIK